MEKGAKGKLLMEPGYSLKGMDGRRFQGEGPSNNAMRNSWFSAK